MSYQEQLVAFDCARHKLFGIVARPERVRSTIGVLVIVGGPQYRVGSHRQFVLLARRLAADGYVAMRFDYRGMGDSEGEVRTFESIDQDVGAAIGALLHADPSLRSVVLWGLCDAASAALMYAPTDSRVAGLVLLNPWIRSESTIAKTYLRHYYLDRFLSKDFRKKLLSGSYSLGPSMRSLLDNVARAWRSLNLTASSVNGPLAFQDRMRKGFEKFQGSVLLMLSGRDLTAQEFLSATNADASWRRTLAGKHVERWDLPEADHTFSTKAWRDAVERKTIDWLDSNVRCASER